MFRFLSSLRCALLKWAIKLVATITKNKNLHHIMPRLKSYVFSRNHLPVCNTFCMVSLFSPTSLPSPPLSHMFIHKAELWNMHLMGPLLAHRMALCEQQGTWPCAGYQAWLVGCRLDLSTWSSSWTWALVQWTTCQTVQAVLFAVASKNRTVLGNWKPQKIPKPNITIILSSLLFYQLTKRMWFHLIPLLPYSCTSNTLGRQQEKGIAKRILCRPLVKSLPQVLHSQGAFSTGWLSVRYHVK